MKQLLQNVVFAPKVNMKEAIRYLGYRKAMPDEEMLDGIETTARETEQAAVPRFVCAQFSLSRDGDGLAITDTSLQLEGKAIARHLKNANECLLMAATLGVGIDALSRRYQTVSPLRALLLDACANSLIEDLCDQIQSAAEQEICGQSQKLTWRFSPGYGDLPLTVHSVFLPLLDTGRRMGLYETQQHLLTPQKSVTAIMGIVPREEKAQKKGCDVCDGRENCNYAQEGTDGDTQRAH